ncbi:MAG TPA: GDSL-type esterase/lipase family protein, partial [Isosphaeraceae bacterium]|nr:GDSL-type esterase/lipase family protein [Isosphaeraceae bacterium]
LAEIRGLDFGRFDARGRGEPRNQGYEYNWARSDATTDDLIRTGQHTGLAAQVACAKVAIVFVFTGGNDFINAMKSPDPAAALDDVLPRAQANYRVAVRTILEASPKVQLVLATVPDICNLPEFAVPIREGGIPKPLAHTYARAIGRYNAQIRSFAATEPRVAIIDLDLATRAANLVSPDHVFVAGRRLDRLRPGNDLEHFFLADVRHPGTLGQSMLARMFVDMINYRFGAGIAPLGDREVFDFAASLSAAPPPARDRLATIDRNSTGRPEGQLHQVTAVLNGSSGR